MVGRRRRQRRGEEVAPCKISPTWPLLLRRDERLGTHPVGTPSGQGPSEFKCDRKYVDGRFAGVGDEMVPTRRSTGEYVEYDCGSPPINKNVPRTISVRIVANSSSASDEIRSAEADKRERFAGVPCTPLRTPEISGSRRMPVAIRATHSER